MLSASMRWLLFVGGIAIPLVGLIGAAQLGGPTYQSASWSAKAGLAMSTAAVAFSPLLAYSMVSLALLLYSPSSFARFGTRFLVRFGVYSGVISCLQFSLLIAATLSGHTPGPNWVTVGVLGLEMSLAPALLAAEWMVKKLLVRFGGDRIGFVAAALALTFVAAACVVFGSVAVAVVLIAGPILASPGLALAAYVRTTIHLFAAMKQRPRFSLFALLWGSSWAGVGFGIWRIVVLRAIERYAELPPEPPSCFICTAAARGHACVVHSTALVLDDGRIVRVNNQMRRLKGAEICLLTIAPRLHGTCRRVYDRVGPVMARGLVRPIAADCAYWALKPLELLAWGMLRGLGATVVLAVTKIYRS